MSTPLPHEQEFIDHELRKWGELVMERLDAALSANEVGVTDSLRDSLKFQIVAGSTSSKGAIEIIFNESGRFVDMGKGRGTGLQSEKNKMQVVSKLNKNSRKPKKWYSKTVYSSLNRLHAALSRDYQKYITEYLKQPIKPVKA